MKIQLTKEECQNVVAALITTSKMQDININAMKVLINLSDKFTWVEPVVKEDKGINKEPVLTK